MNFSKHLTYLREKRGLSKKELASRVGVSATYIANFEHGRNKPPGFEICKKIADAMTLNDDERKKFYELAVLERPNNFQFQEAIQIPAEKFHLTAEVTNALLNPSAVRVLLAMNRMDKNAAKAVEEAIDSLAQLSPEKTRALLKLIN